MNGTARPGRANWDEVISLHMQEGMPPLEVRRGIDGELVIYDGVTRATRVAKYLPGTLIMVEVTGSLKVAVGTLPTVGDKL